MPSIFGCPKLRALFQEWSGGALILGMPSSLAVITHITGFGVVFLYILRVLPVWDWWWSVNSTCDSTVINEANLWFGTNANTVNQQWTYQNYALEQALKGSCSP
jgi:hypothetical protein